MVFCDTNPSVIKWASEEISIPYFSPIDNEYHQYYPDFTIKVKDKTNSIKTYLIEIKPEKQCREPEKKKKSNKTYLHEMTRWVIIVKSGKQLQNMQRNKTGNSRS